MHELGRLLTSDEFRTLVRDSGVAINDGDDEDDNVVNTGLDFLRIDMLALGEAILNLVPSGTDLLVNGGFETGDFSGWAVTDSTGGSSWQINDGSQPWPDAQLFSRALSCEL